MAAGDIYKASEANTTASQREALAALARGGTAELQAFQAAQQQQRADQGDVMRQILDRASSLNAGAAGQEMAAKASPALDLRAQALASMHSSNEAAMGQIGAANKDYFDQVNAAVPLVKARSDEINAAAAAKAQQEEADRQMRLAIQQMQLEGQYASLENTQAAGRNAAAKASAPKELSDAQLKTRLLGAANVAKDDLAARRQATALNGAKPMAGDVRMTDQLNNDPANASLVDLARRIGVDAGIDPMRVYGIIAAPAGKAVKPTQVAHRTDVVSRVQQHASPNTYDTFIDIIVGRRDADGKTIATPATSYAAAMSQVKSLTDAQLKAVGVSRTALSNWLADYFQG